MDVQCEGLSCGRVLEQVLRNISEGNDGDWVKEYDHGHVGVVQAKNINEPNCGEAGYVGSD